MIRGEKCKVQSAECRIEVEFLHFALCTLHFALFPPNVPGNVTHQEHDMANPLSNEALDNLFNEARTYSAWLPKPVDDDLLRRIYDVARLAPTSANTSPMRVVFAKSTAAKERLK